MTNEERKLKHKELAAKHYQAHKEDYLKRNKKYRWEHPDKVKQYLVNQRERDALYREEHREEKRESEKAKNTESRKLATKANSKWTLDDIETLKQMINDKYSYKEIGEKLGRSIKSINHAKEKYCPELVTEYKRVYYRPE